MKELVQMSAAVSIGGCNRLAVAQRQQRVAKFGRAHLRRLDTEFGNCLLHMNRIAYRWANPYVHQLRLVSDVATSPSATDLLDLALVGGNDLLGVRTRFEALKLFDDAQGVAEIERNDPTKHVRRDLRAMLTLFERELLSGKSEVIKVWTHHDRKDSYRVKDFTIGDRPQATGKYDRENSLVCRYLRDGTPVYVDDRPKDTWNVWHKIRGQVHRGKENPYQIYDRRGFILVGPRVEDVENLIARVATLVVDAGGIIIKKPEANNGSSSPHFKAKQLIVQWHLQIFEIQFMTFADFFSSQLAVDDENHELYRQRQCLDLYLPMIFPYPVYGIAWHELKVRDFLFDVKRKQLGWKLPSA